MNASVATADQSYGSAPPLAKHFGPVEFLRILQRRRQAVLLTILTIMGLTALGLYIITPLYKADAVVIVESTNVDGTDPAAKLATTRENEQRIATVMQLLQSRAMARNVVRDLALYDDREFNPNANPDQVKPETGPIAWLKSLVGIGRTPEKTLEEAIPAAPIPLTDREMEAIVNRLMARLDIVQTNKSNLINVTARSVDARKAQRIANKLVSVTIQHQINKRNAMTSDAIGFLSTRVAELRKQLIDADRRVATYRKDHGITEGPSSQLQIDRLSSELSGARSARVESEARAQALGTSYGAGATGSASPVLADLQTQEITLQRRLAELSATYGQGHPDMINAKAQLAEVQRRIKDEVQRVSASLQMENAVRRQQEANISGEIGAARAQTLQQGMASVELMDLERDAETSRTLYVSLLSRLKDLQRQDQSAVSDASFVSRANLPLATSYPPTKRILAVALVASLIFAAIVAFTVESVDNRVRTSDQVAELTGVQTLAMVPEIPENWNGLPPYVAVLERPCSAYSEALRTLHLEISTRKKDKAVQVVVITSPLPGEGKTTIAMSLAAAGAAKGIDSVIVDLDLRRPGLQNMADKIAVGPDLIDYLNGKARIDETLRFDDRVPRLAMIGVRHAAKDPGTMIASPRTPLLIGELGQRFKLIILNTAPLLPVRDAKVLAAFADEVLLIAQWEKTPPDALRTAARIIGSDLTGAVLNRVDFKKHSKLVYGDAIQHYSRYSVYYGDDEVTREPAVMEEAPARHQWRRLMSGLWHKAA